MYLTPRQFDDESIAHFVSRRFDSKVASGLFDPLLAGIFAGDIEQLSVRSAFPVLYRAEQKHGSVGRALLKGDLFAAAPTGPLPKHTLALDEAVAASTELVAAGKTSTLSFAHGMEQLIHIMRDFLQVRVQCTGPVCACIRHYDRCMRIKTLLFM